MADRLRKRLTDEWNRRFQDLTHKEFTKKVWLAVARGVSFPSYHQTWLVRRGITDDVIDSLHPGAIWVDLRYSLRDRLRP